MLAAMRSEIDAALRKAGLRPLTDWTADPMAKALQRRAEMQAGRHRIIDYETRDYEEPIPIFESDITREFIEREADEVAARQGEAARLRYLNAALGDGMTIADAARRWLKDKTEIKAKTAQGYEAVFRLFDAYLKDETALGGSEVAALSQVTRQIASGFLDKRQESVSAAAISREFPAVSGLWRWAIRKGHTEANPWSDMRADIKRAKPGHVEDTKRAFTSAELVALIRADATQLAPRQGGYGPAMFDLIRILLLTGARPLSIMSLTCGDVFKADDGAMALVIRSDKTPAGQRIIPLHPFAAQVVTQRLAALPDTASSAPLWPEVPAQGADKDRAKTISSRFIPLRRRILGDIDAVELYSFRRTFATAADTARMKGGQIDTEMTKLLMGHERGALAYDVYSDWGKMTAPALRATVATRLAPLRTALDDVVRLGLDEEVLTALAETANSRPPMARFEPSQRRRRSG
ncbi:hypothetical protein AA11237_0998 [Acidocella aminolytica 101 = DSM 11237]|nr:hypothetical protein AA11237_0998 [Acidocella aminolytica 101 = DSM 11237]